MIRIRFDTRPVDEVARRLGALAGKLGNLRELYENHLEQAFYDAERQLFASEGKVGGMGWKPLSPEYAQWKARNFPGKQILQRTGAMYSSLTTKGAPGQFREITDRSMSLGSSLPQATYNDRTRPVLAQSPVTDTAWATIVDAYVAKLAGELTA